MDNLYQEIAKKLCPQKSGYKVCSFSKKSLQFIKESINTTSLGIMKNNNSGIILEDESPDQGTFPPRTKPTNIPRNNDHSLTSNPQAKVVEAALSILSNPCLISWMIFSSSFRWNGHDAKPIFPWKKKRPKLIKINGEG